MTSETTRTAEPVARQDGNAAERGLSRGTALLFAVACGLSVANVYFASRCSMQWPMISASRLPRSGSS